MRFSQLVFLSLATAVASFSFTGLPSTATVNIATSGTLIRDNNDPTAFSLLLRLNSQNGGSTIQTFSSEEETSIPFTFTPTESGSFIIEVISNLTPISDTTEPDHIYASSSTITISEPDDLVSIPPTTTTSSSDSASSSQNVNAATTAVDSQTSTTNGNNNGITTSSSASSTSSASSIETTSGSAAVTGAALSTSSHTTDTSVVTTSASSSQTTSTGASAKGALGSGSNSPSTTSSDPSNSPGSGGSKETTTTAGSTNTSLPGSTGTLAPSSNLSKTNTGMIAGIIIGVLAFVAICLALLLALIRRRRRKRTDTFKRNLMIRSNSSPLVFNMVTPPPSTHDGEEYNPDSYTGDMLETGTATRSNVSYRQSSYSEQSSGDMMETGTVTHTDLSHIQSTHSEPSVNSMYSDSPSIFYTAVPRVLGTGSTSAAIPPPTPPPSIPLPPAPVHPSALGLTFAGPSPISVPPPTHPQLAPGWVFPRAPVSPSQMPPPKTSRQMDIYDRKVRLQGRLIGLQGWGNTNSPESQQSEMQMLKDQIRRLELLENSDWAMGKSNDLPPGLT